MFEHEPNIVNLNIWFVFMFGELPEPNLRFRFRFEHMTPEHEPNRTLASLAIKVGAKTQLLILKNSHGSLQ